MISSNLRNYSLTQVDCIHMFIFIFGKYSIVYVCLHQLDDNFILFMNNIFFFFNIDKSIIIYTLF